MRNSIGVGQVAPDFTLLSQDSRQISLADFRGKNLVLFFFPKSYTPVCTAQVCDFRDNYEQFLTAGAEVIGISSDSEETQKSFSSSHHLPFVLLSDKDGKVRKMYEVPSTFGLIPGRVTYIIDKEGTIRYIFNSQFNAHKHISTALSVLKEQLLPQ